MDHNFIVFEGIDRSGKTTQAKKLVSALNAEKADSAIYLREPGGMKCCEDIREILLHAHELTPDAQMLLFFASRLTIAKHMIAPAIASGKTVVMDRWMPSTWAYQVGAGADQKLFHSLESMVWKLVPEVTTFWLFLTLADADKRRGADSTVFETPEMTSRSYQSYMDYFDVHAHHVIDASCSEDNVHETVLEMLAWGK